MLTVLSNSILYHLWKTASFVDPVKGLVSFLD